MTTKADGWPDEPLDAVRQAAERALAHANAYEARLSLDEAKRAAGMARRLGRLEESASALAAASLAHYYQADLVDAVLASLDAVRAGVTTPTSRGHGTPRAWRSSPSGPRRRGNVRPPSRDHAIDATDAALVARAHCALGFTATRRERMPGRWPTCAPRCACSAAMATA